MLRPHAAAGLSARSSTTGLPCMIPAHLPVHFSAALTAIMSVLRIVSLWADDKIQCGRWV